MPIIYERDKGTVMNRKMPGGYFTTNLYFWNNMIRLLDKGYSPLVAIVGKQRIGKSHVALVVAYILAKIYAKPFKVDDVVFYEPEKLLASLTEENSLTANIMDEAINLIHRREWQAKSHILMSKVISTQSYLNIVHIWCAPFRSDLDTSFEKYFDFMIHVVDRGHIKIWQFVKRHDAVKGKEVFRIFLDDVKLNLGDLPTEHWEYYMKRSKQEKERLMKKYAKKREQEITDEKRIKTLLRGAADKAARDVWNG